MEYKTEKFESNGLCPKCGSENIEYGTLEVDDYVWQEVWCNDCGQEWYDAYKYVHSQWEVPIE